MANVSAKRIDSKIQPDFFEQAPYQESGVIPFSNSAPPPAPVPHTHKNDAEIYARKIAARINAAGTSDDEYQSLLKERQALLDKLFAKTISKRETARLEYVRWSLERIEDARNGLALDVLEDMVSRYAKFANDVQDLRNKLGAYLKTQ